MEDDVTFVLKLIDNIRGLINSINNALGINRSIKATASTTRTITLTDTGFLTWIYQRIYGEPIPTVNGDIDYTNARVTSLQAAIEKWKTDS